ncbi:C-X-C motif chemokine 10-like [Thunnus thynnus]|uniref:C-X-C motif chemokine 10-like n=1 Tax=Thunnus thynnus TaxID=8237 RepID=UPI003527B334
MSSIIKVILLLAVMVSVAQMDEIGERCLCHHFRNHFPRESELIDIQIHPVTMFCDRVEILVIKNNGLRFCLNPKLKAVKRLMNNILNRSREQRPSTTAQTTQLTTPVSTASTPSSGD